MSTLITSCVGDNRTYHSSKEYTRLSKVVWSKHQPDWKSVLTVLVHSREEGTGQTLPLFLSSILYLLPSALSLSSLLSANLNRHLLDAVTYLVHFPCWTLAFNPTRKSSFMLLKHIFDAIVERWVSGIPSLRALLRAGFVCTFALPGFSTCKPKPIFFSNGSWNNAPWTCSEYLCRFDICTRRAYAENDFCKLQLFLYT